VGRQVSGKNLQRRGGEREAVATSSGKRKKKEADISSQEGARLSIILSKKRCAEKGK